MSQAKKAIFSFLNDPIVCVVFILLNLFIIIIAKHITQNAITYIIHLHTIVNHLY